MCAILLSLPSRERGLKFRCAKEMMALCIVAPLAGAWIEMQSSHANGKQWPQSLPSRERGLKSEWNNLRRGLCGVAPLAGAWIEIQQAQSANIIGQCRSPRGSVD